MKTFLEVTNFKGIDHLRIEGLQNVNIIYGNNNTCKTSILEAAFLSEKTGAGAFFDHLFKLETYSSMSKDGESPVIVMTDNYYVRVELDDNVHHTGSHGWYNLMNVFDRDGLQKSRGLVHPALAIFNFSLIKTTDKTERLESLFKKVVDNVNTLRFRFDCSLAIDGLPEYKLPKSYVYIAEVLSAMLLCVDTLLIDDFDGKLDDEFSEKLLKVVVDYCQANNKQLFIVTNQVGLVRKQTESISLYKMLYHPRTNELMASHYEKIHVDYCLELGYF